MTNPSAVARALGLFLAAGAASGQAATTDPRIQLPDSVDASVEFALTDHHGRAFGSRDLRGRTALVFFGFTRCPNICPAAMTRLRLMAESLEQDRQAAPAVVLVSVDGERDTPAVLKAYLAGFPANFIGLTGDPKTVRNVAAQFKAVFFKGLPYDDSGNYQVEHTSMIYLVDGEGRLRATFVDAPVEAMAETTRRITTSLN